MEELARESISLLASASAKPVSAEPRIGTVGAVFIMLKSALGAGLLNFPWAFERAGGIHGAVTVELVGVLVLTAAFRRYYLFFHCWSREEMCEVIAVKHVCQG